MRAAAAVFVVVLAAAAYAVPATATAATATAATATAAAAYAVPATATAATATATAAPAAAPSITRTAHVAFENCNARHIVLSVTTVTHAFAANEPVTVTVRLRNTGSTTCGAPLSQRVPEARRILSVGPCGTLPLTVSTTGGVPVYPGTQIFFCPEATGFRLGPHSTAQATGSWGQEDSSGPGNPPKTEHAPAATYRLTVDRVVTVPITLASG
jgi:hypothetical protein